MFPQSYYAVLRERRTLVPLPYGMPTERLSAVSIPIPEFFLCRVATARTY